MLGFLIGTACLIGLIKVLRGGSCGRGSCGWGGGGWGGGGWGGRFRGHHDHDRGGYDDDGPPPWARWGGRRGWGGRGFFLRGVVEHLDASREQEKVIADAVREVRDEGGKWREEARRSRADLGKAMRSESFDEVLLGELFSRHDTAIEAMRRSTMGAMAKVHAVLDDAQRARLAELIEHGPGFFGPSRRRRHEV